MNKHFVLLGGIDCAEALCARYEDEAIRPLDDVFLGGEVYREDQLLCAFSGTVYRYDDILLPHERPEVWITAAWRKYGDGFLTHMEGKFTLMLVDLEEKRLLFARDHFGGMPLYWAAGEDFIAASERLSPLANAGLVEKKLSVAGLSEYFSLRYIPAPDTIFENIHALMPGCLVSARLENGRVAYEERCWWDVSCGSENMVYDYERCKKELREATLKGLEERLFPGLNGVFLSGGIDSTIVTGAAATLLGRSLDTFTIGFKEEAFDESPRAAIAARAHSINHHVYILDYDEALGELDKIIAGFDQPFADDSAVPTWIINRFAAGQGVKNVLTGDGSDQVFAGSNKYFIRHYVDKLMMVPTPLRKITHAGVLAMPDRSAGTRKLRKVFACAEMNPYKMRRRMLQLCLGDADLDRLLKGRTADRNSDTVARLYSVNRDRTDELTNTLYVDLKVMVDGCMMTKMGSMSRLAGVNPHMPLLSRGVLEAAFRIPPEFKQRGANGKIILKEAFADVIPPELMTASKKGFMPPVASWFRGPLLDDLRRELSEERLAELKIFDADFVRQLIDEHVSLRADRSVVLWALYVFSKWHRAEFE